MLLKKDNDAISIKINGATISVRFYTGSTVKISYFLDDQQEYCNPAISDNVLTIADNAVLEDNETIKISPNGKFNDEIYVEYNKHNQLIDICRKDKSIKVLQYEVFPKTILSDDVYGAKVVFSAKDDEAFYGLGQQQNNLLNYAGHKIDVYHNYNAKGGETIGIPFLVSSNGYGIILNTLSQTSVEPGVNEKTTWIADCVKDLSFIVMMPDINIQLYNEYKTVTGTTPMPLKAALGYIQCKQRYASQDELETVVKTYRDKKYPLDMVVVDWFYWRNLGDMSMDPEFWPDPKAMTENFTANNVDTMISVWPRFVKDSTYYDMLDSKGWFMKRKDGQTLYGTERDRRGALIDTTNPECAKWYWSVIKENLGDKGFSAWWTDEDEPDLFPYEYDLSAGKGYEIFNLYPYTHTEAIYNGHRSAYKKRCNILSRSAYLGSQKFGTQFWSSDIYPTWNVLERQIPAAINFSMTGMGYWSSDIGGWQALPDCTDDPNKDNALLLKTENDDSDIVTSKNYTELYIRWFEFGAFSPIFRTHGTRPENEVWSYGDTAEPILVKYLNLRYQLMPYIYSAAYQLHKNGTPIIRGLFLEFKDKNVLDIKNEYMFGENILVAPVTKRGAVKRDVYLPSGSKWYDFWNNTTYMGGQTITVDAPLDTIPLFVKENSIIPFGNKVESTKDEQNNITLNIYGDGDCSFDMYLDDGITYDYEKGNFSIIHISKKNGEVTINIPDELKSKLNFTINNIK